MSQIALMATTTYSFTYTTYSTSLSSTTFSKPTIVPSIFSFAPAVSCAANTGSTPQPSGFPRDRPLGLEGACVISNAREVNGHAFWDLYACCTNKNFDAFGSPYPCTAQCRAKDGQSWEEIGECLSKRVEVVVCKPPFDEIPKNTTQGSAGSSNLETHSAKASGAGAQASESTGSANTVGVGHATGGRTAGILFTLLALGSAAGMLL